MIKLAELAAREALISQDELLQKARDCAFDESSSTAARLGAFQALGLLPSPENAQSCLDFASQVSASPALRAAAIYAASCNGINNDLIVLSRDINSKKDVDPRLLGAANAVLTKSQNATP